MSADSVFLEATSISAKITTEHLKKFYGPQWYDANPNFVDRLQQSYLSALKECLNTQKTAKTTIVTTQEQRTLLAEIDSLAEAMRDEIDAISGITRVLGKPDIAENVDYVARYLGVGGVKQEEVVVEDNSNETLDTVMEIDNDDPNELTVEDFRRSGQNLSQTKMDFEEYHSMRNRAREEKNRNYSREKLLLKIDDVERMINSGEAELKPAPDSKFVSLVYHNGEKLPFIYCRTCENLIRNASKLILTDRNHIKGRCSGQIHFVRDIQLVNPTTEENPKLTGGDIERKLKSGEVYTQKPKFPPGKLTSDSWEHFEFVMDRSGGSYNVVRCDLCGFMAKYEPTRPNMPMGGITSHSWKCHPFFKTIQAGVKTV